jgi:hypothetical protein
VSPERQALAPGFLCLQLTDGQQRLGCLEYPSSLGPTFSYIEIQGQVSPRCYGLNVSPRLCVGNLIPKFIHYLEVVPLGSDDG